MPSYQEEHGHVDEKTPVYIQKVVEHVLDENMSRSKVHCCATKELKRRFIQRVTRLDKEICGRVPRGCGFFTHPEIYTGKIHARVLARIPVRFLEI